MPRITVPADRDPLYYVFGEMAPALTGPATRSNNSSTDSLTAAIPSARVPTGHHLSAQRAAASSPHGVVSDHPISDPHGG